ncbi:MAG: homoserine kinase [Chitinophagaceae bacterium]|nr:MAG: homoserine kinase [Chitinophagaceae bacterium]
MEKVSIKAPGTIANLVCGFDILGLALNEPYDIMEFKRTKELGVKIINRDDYNLPTEPEKNVAGVVLLAALEKINANFGIEVVIEKHIKPGSGLGSSAASAAGAAVGANLLFDQVFNQDDLIQLAMIGEKLATGVKHADNIAPCILGGVTLIRSIHPLDIIPLAKPDLFATVVHPQIEVKTSDARQILKQKVALKDAIKQWGNIAGLVAGFMTNDAALIGRSLEDVIIEPIRSILIPAFDEVKQKSMDLGALGGGISGSGPSIFMLSETHETAQAIGVVMGEIYTKYGIDFHVHVSTIAAQGVSVINE